MKLEVREERGGTARGVESALRAEIVLGTLAPGAQLPTRIELVQRFATTSITVQRALDRLRESEFVNATRRGTFVNSNPPHLTRYGLIFRRSLQDVMHKPYGLYGALNQEAMRLESEGDYRIAVFAGVDDHVDNVPLQSLVEQLQAQRFAGLLFPEGIHALANTPLIHAEVPRVALTDEELPGVTRLTMDWDAFLEKALDYLEARGRKRLAVISHYNVGDSFNTRIRERARARGFQIEPYWHQCMTVDFSHAARDLTHLMMKTSPRPDALLVTDDNLCEHVSAGLIEAGVSVPDELEVVAHCNLPWLTPCLVPAKRLGFDVQTIFTMALKTMSASRNGAPMPLQLHLEPVFAN